MEKIFTQQEERKKIIIETNSEIVDAIKLAIVNENIAEYFASWKYPPRFLEIAELLLFFPDGEEMLVGLHDHIIKTLKDIHIPAYIQRISTINSMHPLVVRDFTKTLESTLKSTNHITNNIVNYMSGIINIPNGVTLLIPRFDEILAVLHPTLITHAIKLLENYPCFTVLLKTNFEKWLPMARGNATKEMLELILNTDCEYALTYVKTNFEMILKNTGGGLIFELLTLLIKQDELITLIQEEVTTIIKHCSASDINEILVDLDERLNLGILNNNDIIIILKEKLDENKKQHTTIGAIVKSQKSDYLKSILKQMLEEEKVDEFTSIGDKTWSNIVFKIGNKVLKLGWIRNNPDCDHHYRLIEPERFETIRDEEGNPIFYIEVQRYLPQDGITEEDIQHFYDDLDNDGYLYIDPRGKETSNFGILDSSAASKVIESHPVSESFKNKSLVLVDRDCVWRKDNPDIKRMGSY